MPLTLSVLASGSRANAILLSRGNTRLLIDVGLGIRSLVSALQQVNLRLDHLSALLITHEHTDHVRGLAKLLDKTHIPVYAGVGTLDAVDHLIPARVKLTAMNGEMVEIGDFTVRAMHVPHDASEPMSYFVESGAHRVTVATDLGEVPDDVQAALAHSTLAVFESNHDVEMLKNGGYPEILKRRIRSNMGHLSNAQSAAALSAGKGNGLRAVVLAHISDENNDPALALAAAEKAVQGTETKIHLSSRSGSGPFLTLD